ncbi:MAG: MarR family transcriptional regulator [Novosphingobium meiothermophilum]|uniref:MarR family transcriptional regulator n=1 Tax=Novosphingobium TaxID=165696 RepID=UPI000D6E41FD|nr:MULTISPECIES: MarR family transcriptional regulator [Novosphingobium]
MAQGLARFDLSPEADVALLRPCAPLAVSIFADRAWLRSEMAEDAAAAGLRVARSADLAILAAKEPDGALGDLVLVDCPVPEGAELAALARLDQQAARTQAHLVVSTSMGALDDVFGCLDQSAAQILVSPSRADRVVALGHLLGQIATQGGSRVRELSESDRMSLLRLTQQVSEIAHRLEVLSGAPLAPTQPGDLSVFAFDRPGAEDGATQRLVRQQRPSLPDPRLVRKIIRMRQMRSRFFEGELFADPAWDMLLDLAAARAEHTRVSVTSLCIASGVPPTTALRWISQMTKAGLLCRAEDTADRRRAFITLSDKAADAMARYFGELASDPCVT